MKIGREPFSTEDAKELYNIEGWGAGYFSINDRGHVQAHTPGKEDTGIDVMSLVKDLEERGYTAPILLRFSDILRHRIHTLAGAFERAIEHYGYQGRYRPVYPIKVNQQRHVVEEIVEQGSPFRLGLEAGSKPELLVAITHHRGPSGLLICNGYKDREYIETALLSQKLGLETIIVVDRFEEIDTIVRASRRLNIKPIIGIRARLTAKGSGKWVESGGDKSKFGLSTSEIVMAIELLKKEELLDAVQLLHFHIGSQITAIRSFKGAMREASRIYVEMRKLGAPLSYIDVGGGLGVDYDGSKSNFHASINYSLQEYANDVVDNIASACNEHQLSPPEIISESGRALTAHHALLIFNVLGVGTIDTERPTGNDDTKHEVIANLSLIYDSITGKNLVEPYHDALELKEEAITLFNLGYLDLKTRALAERWYWACCGKIQKVLNDRGDIPEELVSLHNSLIETYYCNFSIFQSAPDHWAVEQLFPIMPLHRLNESPNRRGEIADLTCDSDGRVDQFINAHDTKRYLELHNFTGEPYYIGMFLVGAYQETLGDLHNLFGDTNAIHVRYDKTHGYQIDNVVEGDTVNEVLSYVQYEKADLLKRLRQTCEEAVRHGTLKMDESKLLRQTVEAGLEGYTYLE